MATRNQAPNELAKKAAAAALSRFNSWIDKLNGENAKRNSVSKDDYICSYILRGNVVNTKIVRKRDLAHKDFYSTNQTTERMHDFVDTLTGAQLADMFIEYDKALKKEVKG